MGILAIVRFKFGTSCLPLTKAEVTENIQLDVTVIILLSAVLMFKWSLKV